MPHAKVSSDRGLKVFCIEPASQGNECLQDKQQADSDGDLQHLLASLTGANASLQPLAKAVQMDSTSSDAWWNLMSKAEGSDSSLLLQLHGLATQLVPRRGNHDKESFLRIWVNYAKQQWWASAAPFRSWGSSPVSIHALPAAMPSPTPCSPLLMDQQWQSNAWLWRSIMPLIQPPHAKQQNCCLSESRLLYDL